MARLLLRDLTPGTAYKIQLRAVEGDSVSEWSRLFDLPTTSDVTAPQVPQWADDAFVVNGDTFVATWLPVDPALDMNKDLSHYEIEFSDGTTSTTFRTNNTSYTLTFEQNRFIFGQPRATVHTRVRAVDMVGNTSAWNEQKSATNPPPPPVDSVSVTGLYDAIDVKWQASNLPDDFIAFVVQVSTTSASGGFTTVYSGASGQYQHATTMFGTDHWFRVYVRDKFGTLSTAVTSGAVRPKSSFEVDTTPPPVPTSLTASITNNANGIGARASLAWNQTTPAENDLAGFRVAWRQAGDTNWSQTDFSHEDRAGIVELQAAHKNYEFKIRSYDWMGNFSAWSATVTATSPANTAPGQVTGVTSVADRTSIRLTWTPSTAADLKEYEVTFSTSSTFASGNITFKTGTAAVLDIGGLDPATTYHFRVRAIDTSNAAGAWSATHSKATLSQLTPGDIGAPTTGDLNDLGGRVDTVEDKVDESVKTYEVQYAVNSSETVAPSSGWSTATPTRTPGSFIWTRTVVTYHDNSTSTTNPALLTGNTGAQGSQGIPGPAGSDGTSLYTWLKYADTPTSGMSDDPTGKAYIGLAYNKTTPTESTNYGDYQWSLVKGADGEDGAQGPQGPAGNGITGTTVTYQVGTSGTTAPTGTWLTTIPATSAGQFLWTRTVTTYNTGDPTTAYAVAAHGAQGPQGQTGDTGKGISSTAVTYQVGSSGTTPPTGTWTTTIPATTAGQYLWTRTITTFTDGTNNSANPAYSVARHGVTGQQGVQGPPGADGQTTYTWIKYATDATGSSMSDDPAGKTYIGIAYNKTTQTESTTATDYAWSLIQGPQGPQGDTGSQGPQGPTGATGTSVTAITPFYARITVGSTLPAQPTNQATPPSPWQATEPDYLFNTELYRTDRITYSNGTYAYTTRVKVSAYTAAVTAITAANGKNKIVFSGSDATGTAYTDGDIWYKKSGTDIVAIWEFISGAWQPRTLRDEVLKSLSVGKLASGTIDTAAITLAASGVIQSANFDTAASGFRLTASGMQIKGAPLSISNVSGLQADLNAKETPSGAQAKADAALTGAQAYVQGKGTDLIVNGYGLLGNNLNFTQFTFDPTDAPTGAAGSFVSANGLAGTYLNNEFLPVDPTKRLKFSYFVRQRGAATDARHYGMFVPYDAFKNQIAPSHYMFIPGTTTTLAAPLNPGDTTITLTSSANWYGTSGKSAGGSTHLRSIIWWDFVDQGGKAWPEHTYSRNHSGSNYWADGAIVDNVITLNSPYSGPARPAGTKLSNGSSGGTYMYARTAGNVIVTSEWTKYEDSIIGLVAGDGAPSGLSASFSAGWPQGVAYARVGWLLNRTSTGASHSGSQMSVAAVSLSDATAAQDMASSAASSADAAYTRWAPSGVTTIDGGKITTDSLDAIKIKANSTFTQNLQVASTFTVGTAASEGTIQSYDYVAGSQGWRLNKTNGLELNKGIVKADTVRAGNLGGPAGTNSVINLTTGTSLILNGGYIKSNTNTGTTLATAETSGAGFFINADGLFIGGTSRIKANALISDTLTSTVITLGSGGQVKGGSWTLSNTGLDMPNGAITAAKIQLQSSQNIMPARQASWPGNPAAYSNGNGYYVDSGGVLGGVGEGPAITGTQRLSVLWGAQSVPVRIYLGNSNTDYNIPVQAGETYIFSLYAWSSNARSVSLKVKWSNGTIVNVDTKTLVASSLPASATRLQGALTVPAGVTGAAMIIEDANTNTTGNIAFDAAQVEAKVSNSSAAGPWGPPGVTTIDGSLIRTGSIVSTGYAEHSVLVPIYDEAGNEIGFGNPQTIVDNTRPAFAIDTTGAAQFSNLLIRGNTILGVPTGSGDGSTTVTVPVTVATTNGSKNLWTSQVDVVKQADVGNAIAGPGIPAGAIITAILEDTEVDGIITRRNFEISANATATSSSAAVNITRPARVASYIKSYNYVEGTTGWILRSDGTAEFRSVAANSLDGSAIAAGTLSADAITSGSISSQITISGSFETEVSRYETTISASVGDYWILRTDGTDWGDEEVGSSISGPGIPAGTIIEEVNEETPTIARLSAALTTSVQDSTVVVAASRQVVISKDGISLKGADGKDLVSLPTDVSSPAQFRGSVEATDIHVQNDFRMMGEDNSLGQGSRLQMDAGAYKAPSPKFAFSYDRTQMRRGNKDFAPESDPYITDATGWSYDHTDKRYYFTYAFFGTRVLSVTAQQNLAGEGVVGFNVDMSKTFHGGANDYAYGGMKVSGSYFYFLTKNISTGAWRLQRVTRTGMNRAGGPIASDSTVLGVWRSNEADGMNGYPAFDIDSGGNVHIAKLNSVNKIVLMRYSGTNIGAAPTFSTSKDAASGKIASLNIGGFDYGTGNNSVAVVTTQGGAGSDRKNYVYIVGSSSYGFSGWDFPVPGNYSMIGTAWVGSSNNDGSGHFVSAGFGGTIYKYTQFGAKVATNILYATAKYRNSTAGTFGPESKIASAPIQRRAKLTLSINGNIPNSGGGTPDSVAFYIGQASNDIKRLAFPPVGATSLQVQDVPTTAYPATELTMPVGTPSRIVAGNNGDLLEINGDGFGRFNRLQVLTGPVNATSSADPGFIVGSPTGYHLRVGNNEIIAMSNVSTQTALTLNSGGETRVANLNVTGQIVGATTFSGSNNDFPNIPSGGSANANLNPNSSNRLRIATSARRFKTNIEDFEFSEAMIDKVLELRPVKYDRISDDPEDLGTLTPEIGFIADEAEEIGLIPWCVFDSEGEILSFDYFKWTVALQAVAQHQRDQINALKEDNAKMKADLEAIKAHLGL